VDGSEGAVTPSESSRPSLFTAIQEQLGLKLELQKGSVDSIVIDHVEPPSVDGAEVSPAQPNLVPVAMQVQSPAKPPTASAPTKLQFDVASVKENKLDGRIKSNVELTPGDVYTPTGGVFNATHVPLMRYIVFAYKMDLIQMDALQKSLPDSISKEFFDIEAKTDKTDATKDEFRMMLRSLLADRFKLAIHKETREMPVYGLVLVKPGKFGPHLRPHPADDPCSNVRQPAAVADYPATCGGEVGMTPSAHGLLKGGARNITMAQIADAFNAPTLYGFDIPIVDKTGLTGTFDYAFEFKPVGFKDDTAPTIEQDLADELGLKLVPTKAPVEVWIVDHVEQPSPN
jgi:uncharacterized protein (TIGR03435 family)